MDHGYLLNVLVYIEIGYGSANNWNTCSPHKTIWTTCKARLIIMVNNLFCGIVSPTNLYSLVNCPKALLAMVVQWGPYPVLRISSPSILPEDVIRRRSSASSFSLDPLIGMMLNLGMQVSIFHLFSKLLHSYMAFWILVRWWDWLITIWVWSSA